MDSNRILNIYIYFRDDSLLNRALISETAIIENCVFFSSFIFLIIVFF